MHDDRVLGALNRILQVLGGDCEQGIPVAQSDMDSVGARSLMQSTQFNGSLVAPASSNPANAVQVSQPGFALQFARALDASGNTIDARIRVYFDRPTGGSDRFAVLRAGQWIKRRRGFQSVWILDDGLASRPVLKVATDPSWEIHGRGDCCDSGAVPLTLAADQVNGGNTYPAYQTVYDSSTAHPGGPPSDHGVILARVTPGVTVANGGLAHVILGFTDLALGDDAATDPGGCQESFSARSSVSAALADGADYRLATIHYPFTMRGDRLQILAAVGNSANAKVSISVLWGREPYVHSFAEGWFTYAAAEVAQTRAIVAVPRPARQMVVQTSGDSSVVGAAISVTTQFRRATPSAAGGLQQVTPGANAATAGNDPAVANEAPISAANGYILSLAPFVGYDYLEINTGLITAGLSGRVHYRITFGA